MSEMKFFVGGGGCHGGGERQVFEETSLRRAQERLWGEPVGPFSSRAAAQYALQYDLRDVDAAEHQYAQSQKEEKRTQTKLNYQNVFNQLSVTAMKRALKAAGAL